MKVHPTKEEHKEAIRKRAKELSARMGSSEVSVEKNSLAPAPTSL